MAATWWGWFSRARGPPISPRSLSNNYHTLLKPLASSPACSHLMLVGALLLSFFCMEIPQSSLASSVRSNQVSKHPSARPATVSYKTAQLRGVTRRLRKKVNNPLLSPFSWCTQHFPGLVYPRLAGAASRAPLHPGGCRHNGSASRSRVGGKSVNNHRGRRGRRVHDVSSVITTETGDNDEDRRGGDPKSPAAGAKSMQSVSNGAEPGDIPPRLGLKRRR